MLKIENLSVINEGDGKTILKEVNLSIAQGELHLLLGPNGAGKSTLAKSLVGWPGLKVDGQISLDEEIISNEEMPERARKGLFLAHQSPVEVPGVHLVEFIRTAYNSMRDEDHHVDPWTFKEMFEAVAFSLGLNPNFSERNLNEGFSGGEKKKNEVLQMILLQPKYAILDEIDSGLDIDSLKLVFQQIRQFVEETKSAVLIISHNPNILSYIQPDKVHLLKDGVIKKSGGIDLAEQIISEGYATYDENEQ